VTVIDAEKLDSQAEHLSTEESTSSVHIWPNRVNCLEAALAIDGSTGVNVGKTADNS